ncbi:MAG: hypothetical protein HGA54_08910, partial [Actinobacteria bacterium]|nr:hypothetical protein [Actinomycetota bacterium]
MVNFEQFGREVASAAAGLADSATQFAGEVGESVSNASEGLARFKRFNETGRDLFISGAVTSHGGNLSESDGVSIWISRRDSMLGRLSSGDIAKTAWEACDSDEGCSRELVVHRAMYFGYAQRLNLEPGQFRAAIVHAHTRHTIFRSLIEEKIVPLDS